MSNHIVFEKNVFNCHFKILNCKQFPQTDLIKKFVPISKYPSLFCNPLIIAGVVAKLAMSISGCNLGLQAKHESIHTCTHELLHYCMTTRLLAL